MPTAFHHSLIALAVITLLQLAVMARVLLRPHRNPASRIAWMAVVGMLPLLGVVAYLLLGEVNIGRRRAQRLREVIQRMPSMPGQRTADAADPASEVPERYRHLFELGHSGRDDGTGPVGHGSSNDGALGRAQHVARWRCSKGCDLSVQPGVGRVVRRRASA